MRFYSAALAAVVASSAFGYVNVPDWVSTTQPVSDPAILGSANATVRLDSTLVRVDPDGTLFTERRVVVEILRNEGSAAAQDFEYYNAASDKVIEANAWIVRQGKEVEQRSKNRWLDVAANADGAIIDETRRIVVDLEDKAVKGDLVVFATTIRSKEFIGDQFFAYAPGTVPRTNMTVEFTLPPGWSAVARNFGPLPAPEFSHEANVSRWILPAVPYLADEAHSVQAPSGLVVTLKSAGAQLVTFTDWREVGQYVNRLQQPQCDTSAELQAKVRSVTSDCLDDSARIRALGRYVQNLRYVAINRNLSIGHGYRPRLASEVFRLGYGDCKDKANLLRALLREIGVRAQMVTVRVSDAALIDESIPSPVWFNHAILAIELSSVPENWRSAVVDLEGKHYLIFDPTNRWTVMGDIVAAEQGTRAFLSLESGGMMLTLPVREGEAGFALKRQITVQLGSNGTAKCAGSIRANGQVAASLRAWIEDSGTELDLEKLTNYQMSDRFRQAVIGEKKYHDDLSSGDSQLDFSCVLPGYAQEIPGGKAVVKFDLFSQKNTPSFPEKNRHKPIRLPSIVIQDEVNLVLGPGLEISDLPKPADLQSTYGKYSLLVSRQETQLVVTRRYELFRQVIPAEDFPKLKQYLNSVAKADRSAAILRTGGAPAPATP